MTDTTTIRKPQTPVVPFEPIAIRRFELPDISEHGQWLVQRLQPHYPQSSPLTLMSRLHNLLNSNEHLFLYQKTGVAIVECTVGNVLAPQPIIREWFCFVRDPENAAQVEQAAQFYVDFLRWARAKDATAIVLSDMMSDVPVAKLKDVGLTAFERKQVFVKVAK